MYSRKKKKCIQRFSDILRDQNTALCTPWECFTLGTLYPEFFGKTAQSLSSLLIFHPVCIYESKVPELDEVASDVTSSTIFCKSRDDRERWRTEIEKGSAPPRKEFCKRSPPEIKFVLTVGIAFRWFLELCFLSTILTQKAWLETARKRHLDEQPEIRRLGWSDMGRGQLFI